MATKIQECAQYGIEMVRNMEEAIIGNDLFCKNPEDPKYKFKGIIMLEQDLLELGATTSVAQGIFYMLPLKYQGRVFVRYLATGRYKTFLPTALKYVCDKYSVTQRDLMLWNVYTDKDIEMQEIKNLKRKTDVSTVYTRMVGKKKPSDLKLCIRNQIAQIKGPLDKTLFMLFIHKALAKPNVSNHRYVKPLYIYIHAATFTFYLK